MTKKEKKQGISFDEISSTTNKTHIVVSIARGIRALNDLGYNAFIDFSNMPFDIYGKIKEDAKEKRPQIAFKSNDIPVEEREKYFQFIIDRFREINQVEINTLSSQIEKKIYWEFKYLPESNKIIDDTEEIHAYLPSGLSTSEIWKKIREALVVFKRMDYFNKFSFKRADDDGDEIIIVDD